MPKKFLFHFLYSTISIAAASMFVACAAPSTPVPPSNPTAPAQNTTRAATNAPTTQPTQTAAPTTTPTDHAPTQPPPTSAPTQAAPVPASPSYFGISTNGEVISKDDVRAYAVLSGAQMVRTSVAWQQNETTPGKYNWDWPDYAFPKLTENNFEPLVLIMENAQWGASTKCGPVTDLLAYEKYLRTLAARYPQVKYWALYNEPDNAHGVETSTGGCFGGGDIDGNGKPDYQDFANQLRLARRALRAANPNAQLVIGAVAFDNFDPATAPPGYPGGGKGGIFNSQFLDQLFGYMQANPLSPGEKYFDVLAFNYYGIYGPYWETRAQGKGVTAKANALYELLNKYGLEAGLLVSETGEDSVLVGDPAQSAFLVKTFVRGLSSHIAHMIWWTFQDFPDSAPPPSNTWKYGLIDQNVSPKPAFTAYQTMTKLLGDAKFMQALTVEGGEGYLFDKNGAGVAVAWSASEVPVSIPFSANELQVTDMFGAAQSVTDGSAQDRDPVAARIAVQIGQDPLYIQAMR